MKLSVVLRITKSRLSLPWKRGLQYMKSKYCCQSTFDSYCALIDLYSVTLKCYELTYWTKCETHLIIGLKSDARKAWPERTTIRRECPIYPSRESCTEISESRVLSPTGIKRSQRDSRLLRSQDADTVDLFSLPKGRATLTWGY